MKLIILAILLLALLPRASSESSEVIVPAASATAVCTTPWHGPDIHHLRCDLIKLTFSQAVVEIRITR